MIQQKFVSATAVAKIGYRDYKPLLDILLERWRERLGAHLLSVVLYGSVARGNARADSDVDLLVVIDSSLRTQDGKAIVRAVERELDQVPAYLESRQRGLECFISSLVFTRDEADQNRYLYLDMTGEAILLFDRDDFFKKRLTKMRARMKELGSTRIALPDGTWYWDVKPDLRAGQVFDL